MNRLLRGLLTTALAVPMMLLPSGLSAAPPGLSTDKTVYEEGEDIFVTAFGEGKDWVGIYARGETPGSPASIYWYYVAGDAEPGSPVRSCEDHARLHTLPGAAHGKARQRERGHARRLRHRGAPCGSASFGAGADGSKVCP